MSQEFKYRAFISYSHADEKWAAWLHSALETYRLPKALVGQETEFGPVPDKVAPVFRDRDELASATDLGTVLTQALSDSACQIVICSPNAARSHWVNEEIMTYKRLGRSNRVFSLIVGGEPYAGDNDEAFPEALRFKLGADGQLSSEPAEPIAADARPGKDGKQNAKLKIIAGMLGVGLDSLKQREQQRRQRRLVALAAAAVVGMTITSTLAVTAWFARIEAEAQRERAEAEAETARQTTGFMVGLFEVSDPSEALGNTITAREILDQGARRIETELANQPEIQSTLLETMGTVYRSLGLYPDARSLLERSLATRRSFYGESHLQVARSEANLAEVLRLQAEFEQAAQLYENAVDLIRAAPDADPAELGTALGRLAEIRTSQGDVAGAERLLREAIDIQRPTPDAESFELARSLDQLGMLLTSQARRAEAEPLLRESLAMRRGLVPVEGHPEIVQGLNNLAVFLYEAGEYEETERVFRELVDVNRYLFGEDHPELAASLNNLSIVLLESGKLSEAVSFAESALEIRLAALGELHPLTALSFNGLALLYYDAGQVESALDSARKALDGFRSAYSGDHADIALGLQNLATLLVQEGDYTTAEPLMREALQMNFRVLPPDHPDIAISQSGMALLLLATDRPAEALELSAAAHELLANAFGEDYWRAAWARVLEGASLAALGNHAEAERLLVEGYETMSAAGGRKVQLETALGYIVDLYHDLGRPELAETYEELRARL